MTVSAGATRARAEALDPELRSLVGELHQTAPAVGQAEFDPASISPADRRRIAEQLLPLLRGELQPVASKAPLVSRDEFVRTPDGCLVPVRSYRTTRADRATESIVIYIHGGGWVSGSVESYDVDVRRIAVHTHSTVISVDYRLAPEHPFPAGLTDCLGIIRATAAANPRAKISVAGDSAGGNLALECAITLAPEGIELAALLLLYPVVSRAAIGNRSYRDNGAGYLLTTGDMTYYWSVYDPARKYETMRIRRGPDLGRLPTTVLATAGFDPLHDEQVELAQALLRSDTKLTYLPSPTLTHGFQQMVPRIPAAERALDEVYAQFKQAIETTPTVAHE